jgi:hypothetical protein
MVAINSKDTQIECLADRLDAALVVQPTEDFLDVILHRQRTENYNEADFDIALAEINPLGGLPVREVSALDWRVATCRRC